MPVPYNVTKDEWKEKKPGVRGRGNRREEERERERIMEGESVIWIHVF